MWWLLVTATFIAAISTLITVHQQPAAYQAKTTLMIGQFIEAPNPSSGEFFLAQQLASAYADITNRKPIREATMQALGLDQLPNYFARAIPDSLLIEIFVTDINPLRAQVVANELANQLILQSPGADLSSDQVRREFINGQLDDIQSKIVETQDEIASLQEKLGSLNSASEIQDTQTLITAQQQKLTTLQSTYATLLSNTEQGASNSLIVVEPADLPTAPVGPNKGLIVIIAAGIGFVLAAGAAYLLDYLDDTLKTPEDVKRVLDIPIIGFIGETRETEDGDGKLYVSDNPRSPVTEAYRTLRANLQFLSEAKQIKSILITSTSVGAGKTYVAANLSAVIAQGGKEVVLVDADLRKPRVHEVFNISNDFGLSNIFLNGLDVNKAIKSIKTEKIKLISSGNLPPNPAEILASEQMDKILADLENMADFVLIDSPPLIVSDALFLAAKVDGVLIVIQPGQSRKKAVHSMLEQFDRAGARVLGVVLNKIPRSSIVEYGGYYSSYYSANGKDSPTNMRVQLEKDQSGYLEKVQATIWKLLNRTDN